MESASTDNAPQVEDKSSYAMEIKTVQSSAFRVLIEALKEILTDANIECDKDGLKIIAMDASQTVLVHLIYHVEVYLQVLH